MIRRLCVVLFVIRCWRIRSSWYDLFLIEDLEQFGTRAKMSWLLFSSFADDLSEVGLLINLLL